MSGSTFIILIASLWFIIYGFMMFKSKVMRDIIGEGAKVKDKEGFLIANGKFNIIVGILGIILGVIDIFIYGYSIVFVIIFVIMMFVATFSQRIIGNKFK